MLLHFEVNLGSGVANIWQQLITRKRLDSRERTYIETCEVGDVVEGDLLDFELKTTLLVHLSEWSLRSPFSVCYSELTLVSHRLKICSLLEAHRMVVLKMLVFGELKGVNAMLLSELCKAKVLALD